MTFVRKAAMILAFIAGCEAAFWVLLLTALTARYALRARRISTLLLWCLPVVDLMLLAAVLARLASGAQPQAGDGLGALYLGFTVMFVGPMTRAADGWFARRFDSSRAVPSPPRYGMARARYEWSQFGRAVIAAAISAALLGVMAAVTGAASGASTAPLTRWFATLGVALAVWSLVAASYTVFPKKDPAAGRKLQRVRALMRRRPANSREPWLVSLTADTVRSCGDRTTGMRPHSRIGHPVCRTLYGNFAGGRPCPLTSAWCTPPGEDLPGLRRILLVA